MKEGKWALIAIVVVAVIAICCLVSCCVSILLSSVATRSDNPTGVACTLEARLCPDGSYVGRNPAMACQFDPCTGK